ncbi:MAG: hypothetical protein IIW93_01525 [Bacteroidaceae bacterium]|nr:hypothetical protein [Bacteroidaceae bacterium]
MKKLLLLFAVMLSTLGAWAQSYVRIPHEGWKVTAPNETAVQSNGREGGTSFISDELTTTFYHSDWYSSYTGEGASGKKGENGVQAFLIELPQEYADIAKITYAGRSDNNGSGWARKVRIYVWSSLPADWPAKALSELTLQEKNDLFKKDENTILGTPAFNNNDSQWANNQTLKTAEFSALQRGKYVLFVVDAGSDNWLTCSDFQIYRKVTFATPIEENKPYYLKVTNVHADNGDNEWYIDTKNKADNTIAVGTEPVPTYFYLKNGYWHISTQPDYTANFLGIDRWNCLPQQSASANWMIEETADGCYMLSQSVHNTENKTNRPYLGGELIDGTDEGKRIFTDQFVGKAAKIQLVKLDDIAAAKEYGKFILSKTGVGYPALDSEARTTLQAAIDAQDATAESVNNAIATYNAVKDVVLPEAGKVYRIVSANPNFFKNQQVRKAVYTDGAFMRWQNLDASATNQMWVMTNINGNNLSIMNLAAASYPQVRAFQNQVPVEHIANESSIDFLGKGQFKIMTNKLQSMHANGHSSGNGTEGQIINYNEGADSPSAWYIEEVAVTKDILGCQINSFKNAYINNPLVKPNDVLATAIAEAENVYNIDNVDYASALAKLISAYNNTTVEFIDLGYFYIKSKRNNKYAYCDNNALKVADTKSLKSILQLTKANYATFYLQHGNGLYPQGVSESTNVQLGNGVKEYSIVRLSSGHFILRTKDSSDWRQLWHDNSYNSIVGWDVSGENTQWTLEPLSEEELAKIYTVNMSGVAADAYVTYNGTYDGGDKDVKADGGFYVLDSAPAVEDFTVNGVTEGLDSKVFVSGRDITVVEGYDSEDIYIIRSKKNFSYARYHSGSKMSAEDETNMLTFENNNLHWESLFYIEEGAGDYAGYYTIRPVSAPNLYVYNLESVDRNSAVATKERPTKGDLTANYYWKISTFGAEYANITPHGADDCGWNKRGSYNGYNHIGYWKGHNNADDNKWIVRKVEEELIPYTTDDSALGLVTYESAQPMLPYIKLVTSENLSKVKGTKFDVVAPKQGEFYRLKSQLANRYMTAESAAVKVYDDCNEQSTIFYVDSDNTLLSYAFGRYLDCYNKVLSNVGTKYNGTFAKKCGASYLPNVLAYNNNGAWTYGNKGNGESIDRGSGNQPNDEGYNWVFEPVTTLPVTITTAGYATFYSPVAVTLPGDLKAYAVSQAADSKAMMTEINGTIPANTGVILKGSEGTYELTIATETSVASDETNLLTGTVASTYVDEESYVLSNQTEGVGFYKAMKNFYNNNGTWTKDTDKGTHFLNNGFKAYLPKPEGTPDAARFFVFDFGTETAIEGIEAENTADAVVYDLAGRRVQNAHKGVFIVNGKVVIK